MDASEETLTNNHTLLQIAGATAKFGGWSVNLSEKKVIWSDEVAFIHEVPAGYSPSVDEGISFYAPEWRDKIAEVFNRCASAGIPYDEVMQIITAGGNRVWVRTIGRAVKDENGEIFKVHGSFQDISELKKSELALKVSENKYRRLHESMMDGFIQTSMDGKIQDCNTALLKMLGYNLEELTNLTYLDLTPEKWHERDAEILINQILPKGYSEVYEKEYIRKDGTTFPLEIHTFLIKSDDGDNIGLWAIVRNITCRKLSEEINKLRFKLINFSLTHTLDEFLEEMLGETEIITGSSISFSHFVNENQKFLTLQHWSKRTKTEFCNAEGKGSHYPISMAGVWVDCIHARKPVIHNDYASLPHRKGMPEGHAKVVRELVVPVLRGGKITAILGVGNKATDYTEQDVETLTNIANLVWEIAERMLVEAEIVRINKDLKESNAQKDKFFSIIAHDLKSPFNSIVGFSHLLIEQVQEKDYTELENYANIILQSSQRAMDLLTNLMEWSRSQTGRIQFKPEYFEIKDLLHEVIPLYVDIASQKSIVIEMTLLSNAIVYADRDMIGTVLRNLISNAIKFTNPHGKISIASVDMYGGLTISVTDSGIGIPSDIIKKIFKIDENYSTPGTQNEKGTGLGLILCKEFVEKNKGQLWVDSEVGKGTTFYFSIPG